MLPAFLLSLLSLLPLAHAEEPAGSVRVVLAWDATKRLENQNEAKAAMLRGESRVRGDGPVADRSGYLRFRPGSVPRGLLRLYGYVPTGEAGVWRRSDAETAEMEALALYDLGVAIRWRMAQAGATGTVAELPGHRVAVTLSAPVPAGAVEALAGPGGLAVHFIDDDFDPEKSRQVVDDLAPQVSTPSARAITNRAHTTGRLPADRILRFRGDVPYVLVAPAILGPACVHSYVSGLHLHEALFVFAGTDATPGSASASYASALGRGIGRRIAFVVEDGVRDIQRVDHEPYPQSYIVIGTGHRDFEGSRPIALELESAIGAGCLAVTIESAGPP